jgi:hypothetical protein
MRVHSNYWASAGTWKALNKQTITGCERKVFYPVQVVVLVVIAFDHPSDNEVGESRIETRTNDGPVERAACIRTSFDESAVIESEP